MEIKEYEPNSHAYNESKKQGESKRLEKVTEGNVRVRPRSETRKLMDSFIAEDIDDVANNVLTNAIIPGVKNLILNAISMLFFGDARWGYNGPSSTTRSSPTSYTRYYTNGTRTTPDEVRRYSIEDLLLDTEEDAKRVIFELENIIYEQRYATVLNYYDLCGYGRMTVPTDEDWGWASVRTATQKRVWDNVDNCYKWIIVMPKARPVDDIRRGR